ncbi:hypothetical protein A6V39_00790 [Candidatus Mycoplasma haematobovis]|uniref:Uncharacterized protein n=1 Tax=Candidatus Mycoplasma haematobovis TaxID=432608 RepID=A0A1A9QEC3_9MOLU|nr:hypothetical protein [Candidatus Mycoplasma haematobovis]OAL10588.1 hypothetical protein A6V39_00790 [Candidatus Mycoplasma haematobovis]
MALSKANKIVVGALTTGGVSGTGAYTYYELTRPTIKDKLGETLLSYESKDADKWKTRSVTLSKDNGNLSKELKKVKDGTDTDDSRIKGWCQTNINNKFTSDKDPIFLEVQKYCTYNLKDKIEKTIDTSSWEASKHNKKLKGLQNNEGLSDEMKKIKAKLADGAIGRDENALKEWCKSSYEKPFKGEQDQDYLDTKEYCVSSDG